MFNKFKKGQDEKKDFLSWSFLQNKKAQYEKQEISELGFLSKRRKAQEEKENFSRRAFFPKGNKAQDEKKNFLSWSFLQNKKAQEEMIGFAIIIVLVSVILLAFLGFSLSHSSSEKVSSYEVENFLYSSLQYTTTCNDYNGNLTVQDLIFDCYDENNCLNGEYSCDVLNETLKGILEVSWPIYEYKGYMLNIWEENNTKIIFELENGNVSRSYKWSSQDFSKRRDMFHIEFKAYY